MKDLNIVLFHCRDARSMRPMWMLEELGLSYELNLLEFPPRFQHPEYLDINPMGTVPFLKVGDVELTESAAMVQYLAEMYLDRLGENDSLVVHPDNEHYGEYLNWMYRSDATLTFPQTLVLRYRYFETDERKNHQVADDYERWFYSRLKTVALTLSDGRDYLVDNRFTCADIDVCYALYLADTIGLNKKFDAPINQYLDRGVSRPAFQSMLKKQNSLEKYL